MRVIPAGCDLKGCDLELRPVRLEDAETLFCAVERNRKRLGRWLPWVTAEYSLEDMRRFLEDSAAENCAGLALTMGIWSGETLCGAIGLHRFDERHRNSSIGYWVDGEHEGRGIVTQACRAIVSEGFSGYGLHRIEIRCATRNERSAAIAKRLRFVHEGVLREAEWLHDHWVDLNVFSMLEHNWAD
jgi:ribosomal-protein-serine acetyltransferase